jgi:hypothetical protein
MGRLVPPQALVGFVAGSNALGVDELAFKGTPDESHRLRTVVHQQCCDSLLHGEILSHYSFTPCC